MLIQGKLLTYGNDLSEAYNIRRNVFISEIGLNENEEFDGLDQEAMHVIVYEENPNWKDSNSDAKNQKKAVATGRIIFNGADCIIDKVAVLQDYRNMKYGDFAVRMLLNKAFTAGINIVTIYAAQSVKDFFKKIGFQETGNTVLENGIEKYRMDIHSNNLVKQCNRYKQNS